MGQARAGGESRESKKNSPKLEKKRGKMSEKKMKKSKLYHYGINCTWFKSSQFKT
jgi:hypothetical protein